ncbi:MAG: histidine kinase dimerization/phospho-acceptor domain-containing protein, partial [Myxococcota bacterium]
MKVHEEDTREVSGALVASAFVRRVLLRQAVVGIVVYFVVALITPWALLLDAQRLADLWATAALSAVFTVLLTGGASLLRLRRSRRVFQALALEPDTVRPEDIGALANLPLALTMRFGLSGSAALAVLVLSPLRPAWGDDDRAISFGLLASTLVLASAVVHYVAVRDATIRAVELSPAEPLATWLEREAVRMSPSRRVARRLLLAVLAPVGLVGVGAVLVTHAHLQATVERERVETARQLVPIVYDDGADSGEHPGQEDARAAAAAHGYFMRPWSAPQADEPRLEAVAGGQQRAIFARDEGATAVRFEAPQARVFATTGIWLALLGVAGAGLLGAVFGRTLARDLVLATDQVSSLGTATVLEGKARVAGPARFRVVDALAQAVEALAERFRTFAAAQERALAAKSAAQRMKQLLFTSVSHDLKSPLNAVLGFADLVREEPLTRAQIENLDMVSGRGRELLALIETILDAARVEEGQLSLIPQPMGVADMVAAAEALARDLHPGNQTPVIVELPPDLPPLRVDPT